MNTIPQSYPEDKKDIHLYDYLEVLIRRKWVVIIFFTVLVATVAVSTYRMTPIYESDTTLLIEEKEPWEGTNILTEFAGMKPSKVQTEIEMIKSRTIAEKVVKKLYYDINIFDVSGNLNPQITDVTIPDNRIGKIFAVTFQDNERFIVTDDSLDKDKVIGSGRTGHPFSGGKDISFTLNNAGAGRDASFKIKKESFYSSVNKLMAATSVAPVKSTNVVKISTRDSNKQMAADMANSIVEFYRQHDIRARSQQALQVIHFVDKQLDTVQGKVDDSLSALAEYKSSAGVTDLGEGTRAIIKNVTDLEKARAQLQVEKYQVGSLYEEIRKNISSVSPSALSVFNDPVVENMIIRLSSLEVNRQSLLSDYTEKHPQVVALSAEINALRGRAHSSIMNILKSLENKTENLSAEIERFKTQLRELPDREKKLADLTRNVEVSSSLHKFLMEKVNEANIMSASTLSQTQIVDEAVASLRPVMPNVMLNIILSMIVGLIGGMALAFFIDYLDNSIKFTYDVEKRLGLPVFGRIPVVQANKAEFITGEEAVHANHSSLITLESAKSITAESFRSLRTNLQFAVMEKKGKIFHLTSSEASEGKTTITANLGITLALMGSRTLIIDLDLRKPRIHQIFGINKEPGITHLLTQKATANEITETASIEHLYIIPAGLIPPNPSELLSQQNLKDFLDEAREEFDYILLDSPPTLPVTDAQLLGRLADATFIVLELGVTKLPAAEQTIRKFRSVGVNVAGAIINKDRPSNGYGYYNYYSYYYGDDAPTGNGKKPLFKFWKKAGQA
ncbi:MAG: polysaccharide biosynthesis tyrosine autokinase [Nitrospiraceae bacterium]|nr:MAG: polysaccharide biosynthesis tyrosine autokinase [Nitrospiraceae bacterium]